MGAIHVTLLALTLGAIIYGQLRQPDIRGGDANQSPNVNYEQWSIRTL